MQPAWTPNDRELPALGAASFIFRHVLVLESSFLHCPKPAFICWCLYQLLTSVKKPSSFLLEIQRRLSIRGNSPGFLVCSPQETFLDCSQSRCPLLGVLPLVSAPLQIWGPGRNTVLQRWALGEGQMQTGGRSKVVFSFASVDGAAGGLRLWLRPAGDAVLTDTADLCISPSLWSPLYQNRIPRFES